MTGLPSQPATALPMRGLSWFGVATIFRSEIIRALVLVFQIIGVFPDIRADDGLAFAAGHGVAHEGIVLVRRGDDLQLAVVRHQPDPAAAETSDARSLELRLEIIEAAHPGLCVVGG